MKFTKKNALKLFIGIILFMILFVMCLSIENWLICTISCILLVIIYYFLLKKLIPMELSAFIEQVKKQNIIIKILLILFFIAIIYETRVPSSHEWSIVLVSLLWIATFIELFKNRE
ncbi:hypothetical protein MBORA_13950 [Methanobrevibacter oralis]|uniref:Uncharacterized protein n=1 Tax=Methanobrevibacter oralis TaxID=66851 RepID=A0A162FEI5_METOA|nr:hypothetical protein MBORA_13950 [Methanobrevibacter oralis]